MKLVILFAIVCTVWSQTAGYQIGKIQSFKLLNSHKYSSLYDSMVAEMTDNRPIKILELVADSHYAAGYDYGVLLGKQIAQSYHILIGSAFNHNWQQILVGKFLDWQYDSYVVKQIPIIFQQELAGLQQGAWDTHKISNLRVLIQRVLTLSSYPGDFSDDILYTLLDEMIRDDLHIKNQVLLNIFETKLFEAVKFLKTFLNKRRIKCSFFALWGIRTVGGKLLTMRNLDWNANTGVNRYKLITIWKIKGTIPHATVGFPGVIGALTGISSAGLTVHEAGLDSLKATELGFQWTLRLRYILMNAKDLNAAKQIWKRTNNTLGMNHMVASAADLVTGEPVFVVETMRNYTAWYVDHDIREDGTIFTDPKTKESFKAGFAMKDAVFRTNHAYDPQINKYRTFLPSKNASTIRRYFVLKDSILNYEGKQIDELRAINITANVAHKGGDNPYKCPASTDDGTNVISVMYAPGDLKMWVGFEFDQGSSYRTACCGVYVQIDLEKWFRSEKVQLQE